MKKILVLTSLCGAIGVALAPAAVAQDDVDVPVERSFPSGIANVPFDLLPPGARSLGLAGAFTAVADDATAAEANPAGLSILTRPEISVHGRHTSFDLTNYNGDAIYADYYDGQNVDPFPLYNKASDSTNAVAFASYVHPFEHGAVSVYYQNTGRIEADSTHFGESRYSGPGTGFNDFFTFENDVDLTAESLGLSAAYRFNDFLAIGGSLRYSRLSIDSISRTSSDFLFDLELQPNGTINTAGISDTISFQRSVDDDDSDVTFNIGILFNPQGRFSAGIVYKDGGTYDLDAQAAFDVQLSCTFAPAQNQNCGNEGESVSFVDSGSLSRKTRIELPDVINVGFAFRPTDTWLVSFDIHHTRFSQLPPLPAESLLFGTAAPNATVTTVGNQRITSIKPQSNSTSYHLGVEHVFVFAEPMMMGMNSLALRGGTFNEKDLGTYSDEVRRNLPGVDTRDQHYTVGLGTTFGQHIQFDIGAEFSDDTDNIVLSGIYRF